MDNLLQDLRYALRSLVRQPSFALTAILTLSLGIAATTAIFSVVNAVVLRPLPYPEPGRIVAIHNFWTRTGTRGMTVSAPDFHDWEAQSQSFAAMAYYVGGETSVTVGGGADYVSVFRVTPGFFDALGAKAAVGRLLSAVARLPSAGDGFHVPLVGYPDFEHLTRPSRKGGKRFAQASVSGRDSDQVKHA